MVFSQNAIDNTKAASTLCPPDLLEMKLQILRFPERTTVGNTKSQVEKGSVMCQILELEIQIMEFSVSAPTRKIIARWWTEQHDANLIPFLYAWGALPTILPILTQTNPFPMDTAGQYSDIIVETLDFLTLLYEQ